MMGDSPYYSKRLSAKLDKIGKLPVTIVAAPAGYGKTSVVYKMAEQTSMRTVWVDVEDATPQKSYERLCDAFLKVDTSCGAELAQLGFPNSTNRFKIASLIQDADSDTEECILVIDNFQFLQPSLQDNILSALMHHRGNKVHIVLLTNHLWDSFIYKLNQALVINTEDFSLLPDEILEYFLSEGVEISQSEAERIYSVTNGWSVAVFLHLHQFFSFGRSINENNTMVLIEELIWNHYDKDMKDCMLRLAPFDKFNDETICCILNYETLPAYVAETLKSTPLIFFDYMNRLYCPHKIVTDFFRAALDCRPKELKDDIYNRAGDRFLSLNNIKDALICYCHADNYEKILELNHINIYHDLSGDEFYSSLVNKVLDQAPCEFRNKYPISMLCFARVLFDLGDFDRSCLIIREVYREAERLGDSHLLGEAVLMSALEDFPNIFKMKKKYERAAELLGRVSDIILPRGLYMFGCPSMLSLFYTEPGNADAVADELESAISVYASISGGHGTGADLLFRGELAFMRCQYDEALIFAYKAENIAEETGQYAIIAGSVLLRGNIAAALNNEKILNDAINRMNDISSSMASEQVPRIFNDMMNTALELLFCASRYPDRATSENRIGNISLHPTNQVALYMAVSRLMYEDQFEKLIGIVDNICNNSKMSGVLFSLYSKIFLAVSYASIGKKKACEEALADAFHIAGPDSLLLPFVKRLDLLSAFMPEKLLSRISIHANTESPEPSKPHNSAVNQLTVREREIAGLVVRGMRNREIANTLYISEGTVRNHLNIVFQKLGIDRRSKLAEYTDVL